MSDLNLSNFIQEKYAPLLNLFGVVSSGIYVTRMSLRDKKHLDGIVLKLFFQSSTALYLANGTPLEMGNYKFKRVDTSTIHNIAKSAIETYILYLHLFITPQNKDVKKFRLISSELREYQNQNHKLPVIKPLEIQQGSPIEEIEHLLTELYETQHYKDLKARVTGEEKLEDFEVRTKLGVYEEFNFSDTLLKAAIPPELSKVFYGRISDSSSSSYLILKHEAQDATKQSEKLNAEIALYHIYVTLGLTLRSLANKFRNIKTLLEARPDVEHAITEFLQVYSGLLGEILPE